MIAAVLLLGVRLASCYSPTPPLQDVIKYFKEGHIGSLALLFCNSNYEKLKTARGLYSAGFQVSYSVDSSLSGNQRVGALLDATCYNNYTDGWFRSGLVEWLVYGTEDLPALPDSSVTLYLERGGLADYFRPALDSDPVVRRDYAPGRLRSHYDLMGAQLSAAHLLQKGSEYKYDIANTNTNIFGGLDCLDSPAGGWTPNMSLQLVENLADQLNFSLKLVPTPVSSCDGVNRLLRNRSVLFSSTATMITEEKLNFLEYSVQLFHIKTGILYKQPGLSTVTNIYQLPFQSGVWYCCLAAVLVTAALLVLSLKAGAAFEEHFVGADEICTLVIGFVCQQGTHLSPRSLTVRTVIVVFSTSALFLYTSYSANIVALLQSSRPTVKTVPELASSPLHLLLEDTSYNRLHFQENSDNVKIRQLVKEKKINDRSYTSVNNAVNELRKGTTAISVECSAAYRRISEVLEEHEKCGLSELRVLTLPVTGLPLVRLSGYRELFARKLSRQIEVGLVSRSERQSVVAKPACTSSDGGFVSVGLTDFIPALLVLLYGAAASLAAFLLELLAAAVAKRRPVRFKDMDSQNM